MARYNSTPEPWQIAFFQRHSKDDVTTPVPALNFLEAVPPKVAAQFDAILNAVASAPPPAFSGGGKWEAMHGDSRCVSPTPMQTTGSFAYWSGNLSSSEVPASSAWVGSTNRVALAPIQGTTRESGSTPPSSDSTRR